MARMTEANFWAARPWLTEIRRFALGRLTSPWAVLGVAMTRTLAKVDPSVTLPPIIGGPASLNLFVALVAPSGVGKGAATAAASDVVSGHGFTDVPQGTGEGIVKAFVHRVKDDSGQLVLRQHTRNVVMSIAEVDTLTALNKRAGATAMPVIRQAFSGETLGFTNATDEKRLVVPAHDYRLCLLVQVQPAKSGPILDDVSGGTPQRFVWLPALDPAVAENFEDVAPPPVSPVVGVDRIDVHDKVRSKVRQDHADVVSGRKVRHELDAHRNLVRLKVAAALALMDGTGVITPEVWNLAGVVMRVSDQTRDECVKAARNERRKDSRRRGEEDAERKTTAEQVTVARARVTAKLRHLLADGEWHNGSALRSRVTKSLRDEVPDALTGLYTTGEIEREGAMSGGTPGYRYRLSTL